MIKNACSDPTPVGVGQEVINRAHLDGALFWTMVSTTPFISDGQVKSFDVYSGAAGRPLRVGIYRPRGGSCQFTLLQQIYFHSIPVGKQTVSFASC